MAVNGIALAAIGIGSIFIYSGVKGKSVLATTQAVIQGTPPKAIPETLNISGTPASEIVAGEPGSLYPTAGAPSATFPNPSAPSGAIPSTSNAEQALQLAAAQYGWSSGAQWTALVAIENQEAGFNPKADNPSSHAYGLAQSLGHPFSGGPAANGINEYGGEGLTPQQSYDASMGDPGPQAEWMLNYIKGRYGDPVTAEQFHLANNWY